MKSSRKVNLLMKMLKCPDYLQICEEVPDENEPEKDSMELKKKFSVLKGLMFDDNEIIYVINFCLARRTNPAGKKIIRKLKI